MRCMNRCMVMYKLWDLTFHTLNKKLKPWLDVRRIMEKHIDSTYQAEPMTMPLVTALPMHKWHRKHHPKSSSVKCFLLLLTTYYLLLSHRQRSLWKIDFLIWVLATFANFDAAWDHWMCTKSCESLSRRFGGKFAKNVFSLLNFWILMHL